MNKVLLGARDGRLERWNVRAGKRVHAYASLARGPGIAHVAASGAVEVVAVARGTGRVQRLNDHIFFCRREACGSYFTHLPSLWDACDAAVCSGVK